MEVNMDKLELYIMKKRMHSYGRELWEPYLKGTIQELKDHDDLQIRSLTTTAILQIPTEVNPSIIYGYKVFFISGLLEALSDIIFRLESALDVYNLYNRHKGGRYVEGREELEKVIGYVKGVMEDSIRKNLV
jgi:endonuclease III-like uncharacterized protein